VSHESHVPQPSEHPPVEITARGRVASRRAFGRALVTAGMLAAGIVSVRGLETALKATFDKPPAPLTKELSQMKRELGQPVRYVANLAAKPDQVLSSDIVETLGTSKYLVRQYTDKTLPAGEPGSVVNLNVNYYDTGSSTPHVPEVCWAGGGWQESGNSRNTFDVKGVVRKSGETVDLRMRLISFAPPPGVPDKNSAGEPVYNNVAYVFHVNGEYVSNPQEVTSRFWKATYKYAYHCKIEVTPMDPADGRGIRVLTCTQEEAKRIVSDFMRAALAEVEECLPDPAILTGSGDAAPRADAPGGLKKEGGHGATSQYGVCHCPWRRSLGGHALEHGMGALPPAPQPGSRGPHGHGPGGAEARQLQGGH